MGFLPALARSPQAEGKWPLVLSDGIAADFNLVQSNQISCREGGSWVAGRERGSSGVYWAAAVVCGRAGPPLGVKEKELPPQNLPERHITAHRVFRGRASPPSGQPSSWSQSIHFKGGLRMETVSGDLRQFENKHRALQSHSNSHALFFKLIFIF